jgi:hypothetical protein
VWFDPCFGGGTRQLVAAHCGLKAVGIDIRSECVGINQ